MPHHCGLLQPLQSSEQTFEESFINFQIWDKRKEIWGLDFQHRVRKRQKGRCGFLCQTTQGKNLQASLTIMMTKNWFSPSFLKGKSILRYKWYIPFLLILNSSINKCWHEQVSHGARQLRPVCTQKVYFSSKCAWKKIGFHWRGYIQTGHTLKWQCIFSSTMAPTQSCNYWLFSLIPQSQSVLIIQRIFWSVWEKMVSISQSPPWRPHIACFGWSTVQIPKVLNLQW